MEKTGRTRNMEKSKLAALAVISVIGLSACASTPQPPTLELQAANSAIANAEQARVAEYALPELNEAREKLAAANTAVQQENMLQARYLATEATAGAELASARAEMIKSREVNVEMQKSIDTLKQELQRNSGVQ